MPNRQSLLFTLAFLTAALVAAAVVLLLRHPRPTLVLAEEVPPPEIEAEPPGGDWLPAADDPDAWWGVR